MEVKNSEVQVLPVRIHAEHNGQGSAADRTVQWSIDNQDLLNFEEGWTEGYTQKDARVLPNINSKFIQEIILRETKKPGRQRVSGSHKKPRYIQIQQ